MKQLTCSVVICTRNRPFDVTRCLEALYDQTYIPEQIVIVDSSDHPLNGDAPFLSTWHGAPQAIDRVYMHTTPGLTRQRNIGAQRANTDLIYFLDDDALPEREYVHNIREVFTHNREYAGGMGAITNMQPYENTWPRWVRVAFMLPRDYEDGICTLSGMPKHPYGTNNFKQVEILGGCCMTYRKTVFAQYRFDEKLERYGYMEDVDFSYRLSRSFPLFYAPQARVQHFNAPTNRDSVRDNRAMFIENYMYLYRKNMFKRHRHTIIFFVWSVLGLFVEALLHRNRDHLIGYAQGLWRALRGRAAVKAGN